MEKLDKVARYGVDGYGRQDIYRDDEGGEFVYHDDFKAMQQRAEAAEAKLAELEPTGWTHNLDADAALVMLDRIDTIDPADDFRIEDVKRIIRKMAAALEEK